MIIVLVVPSDWEDLSDIKVRIVDQLPEEASLAIASGELVAADQVRDGENAIPVPMEVFDA